MKPPTCANMADDSNIEGEDENILYDLLINTEWPPETDTQVSHSFSRGHCSLNYRTDTHVEVARHFAK